MHVDYYDRRDGYHDFACHDGGQQLQRSRDIDSKVKWVENDFELVGEANNGEEALSLLPHVSPHVILTEIRMPKWTESHL